MSGTVYYVLLCNLITRKQMGRESERWTILILFDHLNNPIIHLRKLKKPLLTIFKSNKEKPIVFFD